MSGEEGGEEDMIDAREALDGSEAFLGGGFSIGSDTNCDFKGKRRMRGELVVEIRAMGVEGGG
jgi:hypothetical protein